MLPFIQSVSSIMWPPLTASPMNWLSSITTSAPPLAAKSVKIWSCHWAMGTQRTSTEPPGYFLLRSVRAWQGCHANQITWRLPPEPVDPEVAAVSVGAAAAVVLVGAAAATVSVGAAGAAAGVSVAAAGMGVAVGVSPPQAVSAITP